MSTRNEETQSPKNLPQSSNPSPDSSLNEKRLRGASAAGHAEYEAGFELTGHGTFNRLVLATCCLIYIYASLEMMAVSYILIPSECDLKLTLTHKSLISSSTFVGVCLSALFWGILSDVYGRRITMLLAMAISIVASIASSFSISFGMMFALRFITGIAVSGPSSIILVYLGEMDVRRFKDRSLTICIMSGQIAFTILPALAWIIIPNSWSIKMGLIVRPWRLFMWLWALVGIVGASLLFYLPESPRWILATKGVPATVPILRRIYSINHKLPASDFPMGAVKNEHTLHEYQGHWGALINDLKQLLKPPMWRCLWVCSLGMANVFLLERGFYVWLPEFMNSALKYPASVMNICHIIADYTSEDVGGEADEDCSIVSVTTFFYAVSIVIEFILVLPFLTVYFILRKFLRIKIYAVIMWVCAAGQILSLIPQAMLAVIFIIIGTASGACCCVLQIMAADAFPTSLRGLAVSSLYMAGKLGAVVGVSIIEGMKAAVGCYILMILMALITAGSSIILLRYWPLPLRNVRDQMEDRGFIY